MTTTQIAQERATQLASLRNELINDAARRGQDPRKDEAAAPRTDRKWWEFFCVAHA